MTFSQYAGIAIVPTLSRIVLCAAFIATGYNKVFRYADFTAEEGAALQKLGVSLSKTAMADGQDAPWKIMPAAYRQETPATNGSLRNPVLDTAPQDAGDTPTTATQPGTVPAQGEPVTPPVSGAGNGSGAGSSPATSTAPVIPSSTAPFHDRSLYKLTVMLDKANFPQPYWMSWLAALTEFVGGCMLLIGLFSRVWGLGLAIAMSVAFYLVSMNTFQMLGMSPLEWGKPENAFAFSTMVVQAALFVLAFGIFLTGPGPLSLDRILFGGQRVEEEVVEVAEVKRVRD